MSARYKYSPWFSAENFAKFRGSGQFAKFRGLPLQKSSKFHGSPRLSVCDNTELYPIYFISFYIFCYWRLSTCSVML